MKFKGTKGEWKITGIGDISYGINERSIDVWQLNGEPMEEIEANAKLIAAAPELLEALKQSYVAMRHEHELTPELEKAYYAAEKAINKALGN